MQARIHLQGTWTCARGYVKLNDDLRENELILYIFGIVLNEFEILFLKYIELKSIQN